MSQQNIRWKQVVGGIFIALGLGIYAFYIVLVVLGHRLAAVLNPAFANTATVLGSISVFMANWPSVLLLGFGIAWLWNSKKMVRIWCYRILMAFFLTGAGFFLLILFGIHGRSPTAVVWVHQAAAFCYFVASVLFYWRSRILRARLKESEPVKESTTQPVIEAKPQFTPPKTPRPKKLSSITACNILHTTDETNRLWQFDAKGNGFALKREHTGAPGEPLPFNLVAKSWRSLFQPKLNIAWLPPENVFLRISELPKSSFEETLAMVELQLEKLSPMPVAQIVWMIHVLPHTTGDLQTVIVVIAARHAVEEFLGKLEGQGYLADRLEAPMLDQLEATPATEDGAWIYPAMLAGQNAALVAWWCGNTLRNLSFVTLPPARDAAKGLKDQLSQLTWAGELEGWLTGPPTWHLIADGAAATEWQSALQSSMGETVQVTPPLPFPELAARTARRSAQTRARATLLPPDFSARYHQQFVDRLWFRGLVAAGILYAAYVAIYFCATRVQEYRTTKVERQVAALDGSYTNALRLEARYKVLKERQDLKYAALDCWKIVAENLPAGLTLQRLSFADGQTLSLNGTVTPDQISQITGHFYDAVRQAKVNGQPMFDLSGGEELTYNRQGNKESWRFSLALKQKPGLKKK